MPKLDENKLRKLIPKAEIGLEYLRKYFDFRFKEENDVYIATIEALSLLQEIKKEVGLLEDKNSPGCNVKNIKLF